MSDLDQLHRELTDFLAVSGLQPTASEVQGMFCGMLCARAEDAEARWIATLLDDMSDGSEPVAPQDAQIAARCREALLELAALTRAGLDSDAMAFDPLLPGEDASLLERATGLYDFCRGLLFGLGVSGLDAKALGQRGAEVLADLAEITRLDLGDLDATEDNEAALVELYEFVRVAVPLLAAELAGAESEGGAHVARH